MCLPAWQHICNQRMISAAPLHVQAEAEQLRRVLAEVQAANERLAAQREERRRAAQDLLAKSQVGCSRWEE